MSDQEIIVFARDHLDPTGSIVQSAQNTADVVLWALEQADRVLIDVARMPPISSSFFNVVFRRVRESFGPDALDRLALATPSPVLRGVFDRSLNAVRTLDLR
jgi:hypothetical protein